MYVYIYIYTDILYLYIYILMHKSCGLVHMNICTSTKSWSKNHEHPLQTTTNVTLFPLPEALLLDVAQDVPQLESLVANVNHLATEGWELTGQFMEKVMVTRLMMMMFDDV